jgi:hypothetical protein
MDENEGIAFPRLVVNQMTSTSIKDPGGKNRRGDCVRDFRRFGRFECVPKCQQNGAEQTRTQAYSPKPVLGKKSQVSRTLPDPGVTCPTTFDPVLAATSSA